MAKPRLFTDIVIAGLIAAAASAPIAGYTAYSNHVEAVQRLDNEHAHQAGETLLARERQYLESRRALCADAFQYLEDEHTNPALPAAEQQVLIEDMRRSASACAVPSSQGDLLGGPPRSEERH